MRGLYRWRHEAGQVNRKAMLCVSSKMEVCSESQVKYVNLTRIGVWMIAGGLVEVEQGGYR